MHCYRGILLGITRFQTALDFDGYNSGIVITYHWYLTLQDGCVVAKLGSFGYWVKFSGFPKMP